MTANDLYRTIQIANKRNTRNTYFKYISAYKANYFTFANGEILLKTPSYIVFESVYRHDITESKVAEIIPLYFNGRYAEEHKAKFTDDFREDKSAKNFRKCDRIYRVNIGDSGFCYYPKNFKTLIESADKTYGHYIRLGYTTIFAPVYEYNINYTDSIRAIIVPHIALDTDFANYMFL